MAEPITIDCLCECGIIELQTGPFGSQLHAHDYVAHGVPVIPTEAIRDRRIDHEKLPHISEQKANELARHRLQAGDILFARRGVQATGQSALVRQEEVNFICGTGAIRLRVAPENGRLLSNFLSHVLMDRTSREWIRHNAIGATMPNLNEGIIRRFAFYMPSIDDQLAITVLLDALDDKIELNRRMNETLEAMARAIYKDWFVDFGPTRAKIEGRSPYLAPNIWSLFPDRLHDDGKPEGWGFGTLGDVAQQTGVTVNPDTLDPGTPYIGLEHMPRKSIALSDWDGAGKVTSGKLAFRKGDYLFGKLRPYFHKVGIAPVDGICSTDIVVLNARDRNAAAFVLACISQDEFVAFTDRTSDGTKMPRTSWGRMERYGICLPDGSVLEAFNDRIEPMLERIVSNIHESHTLAALRDLLLPKLMSGEVRVKDAEKMVGEAT